MTFYRKLVSRLVADGTLPQTARILVVCGGDLDKQVFQEAGFNDVTISNVDDRIRGDSFAPFRWEFQNAEQLTYDDASFDVTVVHAGLHHCRSPHRALLEMYRVARCGVLVLEARDSWAMRQACRLGVALDYELPAVSDNGFTHGGVGNGPIPNFVYRWTEREVLKTLASNNPEGRQRVRFFYDLELEETAKVTAKNNASRALLLRALSLPLRLMVLAVPSQGNCFGFWVQKPTYPHDLQPWLTTVDGAILPKRHA